MNFIDELLLKIGKGYRDILSKDTYCGAITTLLVSTTLTPNFWSWTPA